MPKHKHISTDHEVDGHTRIFIRRDSDTHVSTHGGWTALIIDIAGLDTCPDNTCGQRLVDLGEQIKAERLAIAKDRGENETVFVQEADTTGDSSRG